MAKRLFYSCRSPSAAAAVSPTTTLLPTAHPPVVPAPSGGACCPRRAPRRRGPQTPAACGAGGCAVDYGADDLPPARGTPAYRWLKSSRWHVIEAASAYASDGDGDDTPRLKVDARRRVRHSRRRRRVLHRRLAGPASWSSGDSGWFSSDDDGDEPFGAAGEASSPALHVAAASSTTTTESSSTGASRNSAGAARGEEAAAAALAGGFAVVKRSDDPRADFRRSMAEMVVGRGIYDADGLERLLRCFLALNDRRHRRDIVAAFGDVWEAVFSNPPPQSHSHGTVAATSSNAASCKAAAMCHPVIPR
ncbi:unnamed protein product [Miscanthus lutarioriparius]|uniref:Transcription repressor n=1 Tax=Miscanthus lutarioriparius TaxID=422564 RepID=A0A811MSK7_9POAL|nr:unnamed protein product [Miscanthus lutarioriparius]